MLLVARGFRGNLDLGVVTVRLHPPHPQARATQPPEGGEGGELPEKQETACRTQGDAELEGNRFTSGRKTRCEAIMCS